MVEKLEELSTLGEVSSTPSILASASFGPQCSRDGSANYWLGTRSDPGRITWGAGRIAGSNSIIIATVVQLSVAFTRHTFDMCGTPISSRNPRLSPRPVAAVGAPGRGGGQRCPLRCCLA